MVKRVLFVCGLMFGVAAVHAAEKGTLRDPLRPLGYQASSASTAGQTAAFQTADWRLSAVLISSERAVAIINGRSLQVGDVLEGYRLVRIEPTRVLMKKKQKQLVLHRSGTGFKKISTNRDVRKGSQP